jgi:ATP-binding protein involved in chromosome partitioning
LAIAREQVLQALATVWVEPDGADLLASGRLSEVVVDGNARVMFSIAIAPSEAAALEPVRQAAETRCAACPASRACS